MWIRQPPVQARMPSMRPHPLNPRAPAAAAPQGTAQRAEPPALAKSSQAPVAPPAPDAEVVEPLGVGDGGFHESSYELQHGLLVNESEWPDDVTVPAALGER
jgi:hypothetical protein